MRPHDQFLNKDGFADPSTTEETNLPTTGIGCEQIDDFDTRHQDFGTGGLFDEFGGISMNRCHFGGLDWPSLVDWVTSDVHDPAESTRTNGNLDWRSGVGCYVATDKAFGTCTKVTLALSSLCIEASWIPGGRRARTCIMTMLPELTIHSYAAYNIFSKMLLDSVIQHRFVAPFHPSLIWKRWLTHTDTSRTSLFPPLSVSNALRISGNCSDSNLTTRVESVSQTSGSSFRPSWQQLHNRSIGGGRTQDVSHRQQQHQ